MARQSCGASGIEAKRPRAFVTLVSEARLGRNTTTVTNGSLSRAPISGVTNRPVEKGRNSNMFQEKVTRT